jgi:hypothetical protein
MTLQLIANYVQKSKLFILPLICPRPISEDVIVKTYLELNDDLKVRDCHFILELDATDNPDELKEIERKYLFMSPYLRHELFKKIKDNHNLYVFDLRSISQEYEFFVKGQYSLISAIFKDTIIRHYNNTRKEEYIRAWLYPDQHRNIYADLLGMHPEELHYELCNKPDLDKEKLVL